MADRSVERLERLTPRDLDEAQLTAYEAIIASPRGSSPGTIRLVDDDGALAGPFGIMLHAPSVGLRLQALGAAIRFETELTGREREIAILTVAAATRSGFEQYAHQGLGAAVGLTEHELAGLAAFRRVGRDDRERAVEELCHAMLSSSGHLSDGAYGRLVNAIGTGALIEVIVLVGYYRTLAQLMTAFGVEAPT